MSQKYETRLQKQIQRYLVKAFGKHIFLWKVHGGAFQRAGIGDLCCCIFGFYFNIEVKTPQDKRGASALQEVVIKEVIEAGGCAFVTTSPHHCLWSIKRWLLETGPTSLKQRRLIREALKATALQVSERSIKSSPQIKRVRLAHGTRDWKDDYRVKSSRSKVAKRAHTSSISSRP